LPGWLVAAAAVKSCQTWPSVQRQVFGYSVIFIATAAAATATTTTKTTTTSAANCWPG